MATSQNYEELEYVWAEWRKKTGDLMKDDYVTYVDLMNKAATENGILLEGVFLFYGLLISF